jgi:hypothetical protein
MRRSRTALLAPLLLWLLAGGCDDPASSGTATRQESELTFVRMAPDAPALNATEVSFWAKRGQDTEGTILYTLSGYDAVCLRFAVPAGALTGPDSVLITVRVPDPSRFDYEFSPGGLRFDPDHPAEIEIHYRWADPDFNQDGVVDEKDTAIAGRFGYWRQERPGEPWTKMETTRSETTLVATAKVAGFTRYALASE